MNLFVIAAGLMVAAHVVAALQRPRPAVIVSGILWALYAYYEYLIATGVLCDANCNIRVDLVLFFPILGLATFWAYQSYMGRPGPQKVVGIVLGVIGLLVVRCWWRRALATARSAYAVDLGWSGDRSPSMRSNRGLRPIGRDAAPGFRRKLQCAAPGTSGMYPRLVRMWKRITSITA